MRRGLPYLLALLLGMSATLLAACGAGSTKSGVPSASAGELKSQITDVGQAVDGGRCDEVEGQLEQVDDGIEDLPQTTDDQLVSALRDGAGRLREVAIEECEEDAATTTETTPADEEPTETTPADTEPTETSPTETTQEPTTTAPPPPPPATGGTPPETPPPPPPVTPTPPQPQPQPPVSPGGGVTPQVDPDG